MAVTFKYGDYNFTPKPLFSISTQPLNDADGTGHGLIHTINLEGDLIIVDDETSSGVLGVFDKVEKLKDALDHDGKLLLVDCTGVAILSGYPTVESYNIDRTNDNYTRRATYTIEFKMPTTILGSGVDAFNSSIAPPFIESCNESWDIDFADERMPFDWTLEGGTTEKFGYKLAVTHTVNVQARIAYTGDRKANIPWENARDYASTKLGFDNDFVTLTGVLGLPGIGYYATHDAFNNYRKVAINKSEGNVQIVETFIVSPSGSEGLPHNAIETFDISTSQNQGIVNVSINGNIEGLCVMGYAGDGGSYTGIYPSASKYTAASGYYDIVKDRMYDRARTAYSGIADSCFNRKLNPILKSRTVGINPIEGRISYDYQYDTTPPSVITGPCVLSQNISIDDQLMTDVIASHIIPGKAAGPILQDIGTPTVRVRTVNVEIATLPPSSCATVAEIYSPVPTGQVNDFIAIVSGELGDNFSQVFVSSHSQNWNFTAGRYTKNMGFTYTNCSV